MSAVTTTQLDPINGVVETPTKIASGPSRHRDRDNFMVFGFLPGTTPFSGTVHVQASTSMGHTETEMWFDVAEMEFTAHTKGVALELNVDANAFRVVCRTGNYKSGGANTFSGTAPITGVFQIDGLPVNVASGDDLSAIATAVTATLPTTNYTVAFNDGVLTIVKHDATNIVFTAVTINPSTIGFDGPYTSGSLTRVEATT